MARKQETRSFERVSPDDVFEASQVAFKQLGMEVWKLRSIAWLSQARINEGPELINANMMARPGAKTEVTLTVSGENAAQEAINTLFEQIFSALEIALSKKK